MKILIVRTFPNFLDATRYNVQEIGLAKALVRAGHEVGIVLYNGKSKDNVQTIEVDSEAGMKKITVYYLHGWNFFKNGIFPSLRKVVKQYDVIQVHEYDQLTSWWYYAWSKKNVVIYHGPYYDSFNRGYNLKCKIFDAVFLRLKHNREIPCMTKSYAAADFLRNKGFTNVTAVGVGLDVDNFSAEILRDNEMDVENGTFTLLYVGKIEKRRNSLFLAEIIREITTLYDDVRIIVIGTGDKEYVEEFLSKIQPFIENGKVRYFKSASQVQLSELYKKSSLMLFPSSYEIYGMVLAEAVYFGLPVISTSNGGADMLITDSKRGVVIPSLDLELWITAIENYYMHRTNTMHVGLDADDRKKILWDGICEKMIDVYQCKQK